MYAKIGGVQKELSAYQAKVGGVLKEVTGGYANKGGVLYPFAMSKDMTLGKLAVGTVVKTNVNGTLRNFIVINQGVPSSTYDSSCNGTWLLMQDIYERRVWHTSSSNSYSSSAIHSYLNSTFLNLFDSNIKSVVKTVKIPYTNGKGNTGSLATGSDGLSTQVFLLSAIEIGFSEDNANVEGAVLSYFNGVANSDRIAYFDGTAAIWWLRSPYVSTAMSGGSGAWFVNPDGSGIYTRVNNNYGIRPAIILPSDTVIVDGDFNIVV